MVKRFFMKFYLVLIIAFLYIPIAVLVVLSFNASRSRVVWGLSLIHISEPTRH